MADPRVERLADILVGYSTNVRKNDIVIIDFSGTRPLPLIEAIYKRCLKKGAAHVEYNFSSEDNLSSLLIPSLQFLLKSLKLKPEDIDVFGIGIGPGLFTGIRIGLATLKGMLFGLRKPFVPVVTLHALAFKFVDSIRSIIPLIDAKRNEVYMGCYRSDEGGLVEAMETQIIYIIYLRRH